MGSGLRAHIGSFTSAGGRGITTAAVDPATGGLTPLSVSDAVADPSYLALSADGGVLYAVSESERGAVQAFRTSAGGGLTVLGPAAPVGGSGPTHLSVAGRRLFTAHYTTGGVGALPLAPDGRISGAATVVRHRGSGPDPDRQGGPHAHQVLPDPGGRWVLGVDLGTDSVRVYGARDPELRLHAETALSAGNGPRHLAFHPDGEAVYVLGELRPLLTVCRWDAAAGRLEVVGEVPVAQEAAPGAVRAYPSAVVVAPDGRFVWAAVRGADTIAVLSLADGPLLPRPTACVPSGGHWPRDLALGPAGRLYAAHERSGDVTWFDVDPATGRPHRAGSLAVPAATCVVFG
ncbi:lactonase family protein [Streptomyces antimicrobicus]|uniref:Lactonase family protein n=1 Tax=Streptomyces antimicrobicus TaxID=2883108 RepID=A0ABS8B6I8_9ACTN|nr:lactonase family protein [Streptomyces antimicrobicus]MCB5180222.1 lactonase family protein [Streptomyces antimicrobicus]